MALEEENRVISFFHFTCTPSAKADEIDEARLTALRNHKQQPIPLDAYSEESDVLSDFNEDDKEAIEQTQALEPQQRDELLLVYSEFAQGTTSSTTTTHPPNADVDDKAQQMFDSTTQSPAVASPPQSQTLPVPHRGRGRPPKNMTAMAASSGTPINGRRTPVSEDGMNNGFPPGVSSVVDPNYLKNTTANYMGIPTQPSMGNNMLPPHGGVVTGMLPPPIAINSSTIPAVAANASSPALYVQQRELPTPLSIPPPLPPCPWFDPTAISPEEATELATAFPLIKAANPVDSSNLAAVAYLQLRNTLIDVYRQNPTQKLTLAECRKHCDGDLSVVIRMLSFLERNRLINYALTPNPNQVGGTSGGGGSSLSLGPTMDPITRKLKDELRDHWTRTPTCTACDRICLYSFYVLSPNVYGSMLPLSHLHPAVWCSDCAREAPHNQCLLKVNLPPLHVSGGGSSWSEQQINVLFDAIEAHVPDWLTISRIVSKVPGNPTRSPSECLAVFLSMPLAENPGCVTPSTAAETTSPGLDNFPTSIYNNNQTSTSASSTEHAAMEVLLNAVELLSRNASVKEDQERSSIVSEIGRSAEGRLNHLKLGTSSSLLSKLPANEGGEMGSSLLSPVVSDFNSNHHGLGGGQKVDDQQQQQSRLSRLNQQRSCGIEMKGGDMVDDGNGMWSEMMVAHPGLTSVRTTTTVGEERGASGMDESVGIIVSSNSGGTSSSAGAFLSMGSPSPGASDVAMNAAEVTLDSMLNDISKT